MKVYLVECCWDCPLSEPYYDYDKDGHQIGEMKWMSLPEYKEDE